ncbi:unnamed protein product [Cercospora beticola]|nr:unnamed protein product [Cercospora beticola]
MAARRRKHKTNSGSAPVKRRARGRKSTSANKQASNTADSTTSTVDQPEEKAFRFLDLPTEIRLLVYEHLLVANTSLKLRPPTKVWKNVSRGKYDLHPSIIATCQPVYLEAVPILYGYNEFEMTDIFDILGLSPLLNRYREHASRVTAIHVDFDVGKWSSGEILSLLKGCKALSKLTIGRAVWSYYEDAQAFAKAFGPLFRMLHKNQQKKQDVKPRDVLDGLHLQGWTFLRTGTNVSPALKDMDARETADFADKVENLLRSTFK